MTQMHQRHQLFTQNRDYKGSSPNVKIPLFELLPW